MQSDTVDTIHESYSGKPTKYFSGTRADLVDRLPVAPHAAILEIGCGSGDTGAFALASRKCGRYYGIEIQPDAAERATHVLTEVLVGNFETMSLSYPEGSFDVVIIGEVLEHLVDPWKAVQRLAELLKPAGTIIATTPNISHWRVIRSLLAGRFDYVEMGIMDRTHLRWFTPATFCEMFVGAGFIIDSIGPSGPFGRLARIINVLTRNKIRHLFCAQMTLFGRRSH